jgi:hypothetical protein
MRRNTKTVAQITGRNTSDGCIVRLASGRRVFVEHAGHITRVVCDVDHQNQPVGTACLYMGQAAREDAVTIASDFAAARRATR